MTWRALEVTEKEIKDATSRLKKRARFLVDESLGIGTTDLLRELGWNTKDVSDVGLTGKSDEEVMAYAFREKRILLSHDSDFLNDKRFPTHRCAGVVVLPGGSGDEQALIRGLIDMLQLVAPFAEYYQGAKMEITSEKVFKFRSINNKGVLTTTRYKYGGRGPVCEWVDD